MLVSTKGRYALRVMIDLAGTLRSDGLPPLRKNRRRQNVREIPRTSSDVGAP